MPPTSPPSDDETGAEPAPLPMSVARLLFSGVVFAALWVTLAGYSDPSAWIVGLPTVIAAAWFHDRLSQGSRSRLSVVGGIQLIPFFLRESFTGGIDVARRVVWRRVNVDPGFFDYRLGLTLPSARVLFVDLVSLLPGTLSADFRGDTLHIHTLDRNADPIPEFMRLERRVAALYRETLPNRAVPAP